MSEGQKDYNLSHLCRCIYDLEAAKLVVRVRGHSDDVNAIRYADESSHILFSGSDDRLIKVTTSGPWLFGCRQSGGLILRCALLPDVNSTR